MLAQRLLSPVLFKLCIDDVVKVISCMNVGCRLGISRMIIIAYADGIAILADSGSCLKFLLTNLEDRIESVKLKCMIYQNKTRSMNNGECY